MISINLLRISPDSQYLEFSIACPTGYKFNTLNIKKYDFVPDSNIVDDDGWRDCSNIYASNPDAITQIMRINVNALSKDTDPIRSTMFYVEFGVTPTIGTTEIPNVMALVSDVNKVYDTLKNHILNLDANCISQIDFQTLIKHYMFLYAHIESMRLERFDEAEMYYNILKKYFTLCGNSQNKPINNTCNCK